MEKLGEIEKMIKLLKLRIYLKSMYRYRAIEFFVHTLTKLVETLQLVLGAIENINYQKGQDKERMRKRRRKRQVEMEVAIARAPSVSQSASGEIKRFARYQERT